MVRVVWEDLDVQWKCFVRDASVTVSVSVHGCEPGQVRAHGTSPKAVAPFYSECWLIAVNLDTDLRRTWTLWVV